MTRIVFMGTPDFAAPTLAGLLEAGYDVRGVFTAPDQPAGRGRQLEEPPVKALALARGVPVFQPPTLRDPQARAELAALAPDLIVVAAYGLLLPPAVLQVPRHRCLNVHASLLPRHRGAAPIAAAILAGDPATGVTIMVMEPGLDTGPVLSAASLPIEADDTTGSLTQKLSVLGAQLLLETLPAWLQGDLQPSPQDEAEATYAARISKDAGEIRWQEPASLIERKVRAYDPWPSAYTFWNGQRLKLIRARASEGGPAGQPGQVVRGEQGIGVVTGSGVLWLLEVQLAGRRALEAGVFVRGAPGFLGAVLPS